MLLAMSVIGYTLACIILLTTFVIIYFKYSYTYWSNIGVFSPPTTFPFGHFKELLTHQLPIGANIKIYYDKYKPKGHKFIGLYAICRPSFLIFDINLIKTILTEHFEYFTDRDLYNNENDPLSTNLLSLTGHEWKNLRQKLTPTFTAGKMKNMFPTLLECSEELSDCLNEPADKNQPIDIKAYLVKYTADVIGSCAFGIDCNSFKEPDSEFLKYGILSFSPKGVDWFKFIIANMYPNIMKFFKCRVINSGLHNFFMGLVKQTVEYRENNNISRNDFMQLLIQLKNQNDGLSMDQITAQSFLFFIAGFETSSTTLTFCLYELSKNPVLQERTRREMKDVLKEYDGKITYEAIHEMKLTHRVILETLRKHPPAMLLRRIVTKNYTIPNTNIVLKKGTIVSIPIFGIHHDPEYYPDPEKFDPERFTDENKSTRSDFTWLPFGGGPRICIGMRFGILETKIGLCKLLLNYKFTVNNKTVEPLQIDPRNFMKTAKGGVWLNAEKLCRA